MHVDRNRCFFASYHEQHIFHLHVSLPYSPEAGRQSWLKVNAVTSCVTTLKKLFVPEDAR